MVTTSTSSAAKVAANRENSLKSTGPSELGRLESRKNALRHGMSGSGAVLPDAVAEAVKARYEALMRDMAPKTEMGTLLIKQMALTSVRMEKCGEQAIAANAEFVRHAKQRFDEERIEKAEQLWNAIEENPRGNLRKLRQSPEGVELMVQVWEKLRLDLTREGARPAWTESHLAKAAHLTGFGQEDARHSPFGRLSRAIWGDFTHLSNDEGGWCQDDEARKEWARTELVAVIDMKIEALETHYDTLDFATIAQDRAEAPIRAQFDPSKEASLARRYEAAARRAFHKAMEEYRIVESIAVPESSGANPSENRACGTLASSGAGPMTYPGMPIPGMYRPHYYRPADPRDAVQEPDEGAPKGKVPNRQVL